LYITIIHAKKEIMKNLTYDIPLLLCKKATQSITSEEEEILQKWVNENEENRKAYEEFMDKDFLEKELATALDIDTEAPRKAMEKRIKARGRSFLRYAAAIALLIVGGAAIWYSQYTKVTPPEISESVQLAMQQSIQNGKTDAVIEEMLEVDSEGKVMSGEQEISDESHDAGVSGQEQDYALPSHNYAQISQESLTKEQLLAAHRVTTRHDKEFWITLDDGTLVHLNYNTHLIYPEHFGRSDRNVILDGEAYFMVARDKSRPFVVHTPGGSVKVYGTEFNVNTRNNNSNGTSTSVVLVKGSIGVTPNGLEEQRMKPGQQAVFSNNAAAMSIDNVDVSPFIAWNIGTFVFENCTMEKLMSVLSKWYNYDVTFNNHKAQNIKFTGELDKYSSIEPVIEAIEQVTGLDIKLSRNTIVIN